MRVYFTKSDDCNVNDIRIKLTKANITLWCGLIKVQQEKSVFYCWLFIDSIVTIIIGISSSAAARISVAITVPVLNSYY